MPRVSSPSSVADNGAQRALHSAQRSSGRASRYDSVAGRIGTSQRGQRIGAGAEGELGLLPCAARRFSRFVSFFFGGFGRRGRSMSQLVRSRSSARGAGAEGRFPSEAGGSLPAHHAHRLPTHQYMSLMRSPHCVHVKSRIETS